MANVYIKQWYDGKNISITKSKTVITTKGENDDTVFKIGQKIFSLFDFEYKISRMHVDATYKKGEIRKREDLEDNEIPYLVWPVYYYLAVKGEFPTLEQATAAYLQLYCDKIADKTYQFKEEFHVQYNPVFSSNDIRNRMYRSYFSFVREIHLLLKLMNFRDISVRYDFITDTKDGLDIIANCNGNDVYIASYVGTKSSLSWKKRKNNSKHDYSDFQVIDAIAWLDGPDKNVTKLGDAWVYSDAEIKKIHDEIISKSEKIA